MGWLDELFSINWVDSLGNKLASRQKARLLGPGAPTAVDNPTLGTTDLTFPSSGSSGSGQTNLTLSNGLNSNISTAAGNTLRVGGPTAAFSIGGFTPTGPSWPVSSRIVFINTTAFPMTIVHEDTGTTAANRVSCPNGLSITIPARAAAVEFSYDTTINRFVPLHTGFRYDRDVNVRDFGAIGDGAHDDAPAINAAIAAAGQGGAIYFPSKPGGGQATYAILGPLRISSNATQIAQRWYGDAPSTSGFFTTQIVCQFPLVASGTAASITSLVGLVVTIGGLSGPGLSNIQVGDTITLSGCATAGNNFFYTIASINVGAGTVTAQAIHYDDDVNGTYLNTGTDANNGSIHWNVKHSMIQCYSRDCSFENIEFHGLNNCAAVFDCTKDSGGSTPNTQIRFANCHILDGIFGVKIGDLGPNTSYPNNCEFYKFEIVAFDGLTHSAIYIPNTTSQSKSHLLLHCLFTTTPYAVWVNSGSFNMYNCGGTLFPKQFVYVRTFGEPINMYGLNLEDPFRVAWISGNSPVTIEGMRVDYASPTNCASDGLLIRVIGQMLSVRNVNFVPGETGIPAIAVGVAGASVSGCQAVIQNCNFNRSDDLICQTINGGYGSYLSVGNFTDNGTTGRKQVRSGMRQLVQAGGPGEQQLTYPTVPWTLQAYATQPYKVINTDWTLANGLNSNLPLPTVTNNVLQNVGAGPPSAAFTIGGVAAGNDGHVLRLYNASGLQASVRHLDSSSSAANRIICPDGKDLVNFLSVEMFYVGFVMEGLSASPCWLVTNYSLGAGSAQQSVTVTGSGTVTLSETQLQAEVMVLSGAVGAGNTTTIIFPDSAGLYVLDLSGVSIGAGGTLTFQSGAGTTSMDPTTVVPAIALLRTTGSAGIVLGKSVTI